MAKSPGTIAVAEGPEGVKVQSLRLQVKLNPEQAERLKGLCQSGTYCLEVKDNGTECVLILESQ